MYVWTGLAAQAGEPSPLLSHLAGEFAPQVAALWPAPHADVLTATAARRHLLFLALAHGGAPGEPRGVLEAPLARAVALALPQAPEGLARALGRMGEVAWSGADYRALVALLDAPQTAKLLRHAKTLEAGEVRALAALPAPLLREGLARIKPTLHQARLIGEAFDAIVRRDGPGAAEPLARRWCSSGSAARLFERLRDDLLPEVAAPPFPGTALLRPLASKAAMRDAARRYRNCLRREMPYAADGVSAYYEWLGEPGAVVEIHKDRLVGWRLHQARLAGNEDVPASVRKPIIAELRSMGVYVGRPCWAYDNAANAATGPGFTFDSEEEAIAWFFED